MTTLKKCYKANILFFLKVECSVDENNKTKLSLIPTLLITLPLKLNQIYKLFMIQKSNFSASPEVHFLWCEVVLGMLQEFHMKKRRRVCIWRRRKVFYFFFAKIYGRTVCQHDIQLFCGDLCIGFPIMLTTNVWPQNIDAFLYGTDLLTFRNKQLYFRGLIFKGLCFEILV